MKYIIYELVQPDVLQKTVPDGYYLKNLIRNVLEELDECNVNSRHDTFELALQEIVNHKDELRFKDLTILPIISIDYNCEICE